MSIPLAPGIDQRTPTSVHRFISRMTRSSTPVGSSRRPLSAKTSRLAPGWVGEEGEGVRGGVNQAWRPWRPRRHGVVDQVAVGARGGLEVNAGVGVEQEARRRSRSSSAAAESRRSR